LIATGEYDNFTLPQENAAVARQCVNGTFALIRNADHLAQFEQKQSSMELVHRFMCGDDLHGINGIDIYDPQAYDHGNQRLQRRHRPLEQAYRLINRSTGKEHLVRIKNLNFSGCELEQIHVDLALSESDDKLYLKIPETGTEYHIRILGREKKTLRCLLIQRDLKEADKLLKYLTEHLLMVREIPAGEVAEKLA
jgi:hypothetical protein